MRVSLYFLVIVCKFKQRYKKSCGVANENGWFSQAGAAGRAGDYRVA